MQSESKLSKTVIKSVYIFCLWFSNLKRLVKYWSSWLTGTDKSIIFPYVFTNMVGSFQYTHILTLSHPPSHKWPFHFFRQASQLKSRMNASMPICIHKSLSEIRADLLTFRVKYHVVIMSQFWGASSSNNFMYPEHKRKTGDSSSEKGDTLYFWFRRWVKRRFLSYSLLVGWPEKLHFFLGCPGQWTRQWIYEARAVAVSR